MVYCPLRNLTNLCRRSGTLCYLQFDNKPLMKEIEDYSETSQVQWAAACHVTEPVLGIAPFESRFHHSVLSLIVLYLSSTSAVPHKHAVRYRYHCVVSGASGSALKTNHQWNDGTSATVSLLSVPTTNLDNWTALQSWSRQRAHGTEYWGLSVRPSVCHIILAHILWKILPSVKSYECLSLYHRSSEYGHLTIVQPWNVQGWNWYMQSTGCYS
jgi:hypothetical protein